MENLLNEIVTTLFEHSYLLNDIVTIAIETTDDYRLIINNLSDDTKNLLSRIEYEHLNEEFNEFNIFMKDGSWFELEQFQINDEWYTHLVHRIKPSCYDENINLLDFVMLKKPEPEEVV